MRLKDDMDEEDTIRVNCSRCSAEGAYQYKNTTCCFTCDRRVVRYKNTQWGEIWETKTQKITYKGDKCYVTNPSNILIHDPTTTAIHKIHQENAYDSE